MKQILQGSFLNFIMNIAFIKTSLQQNFKYFFNNQVIYELKRFHLDFLILIPKNDLLIERSVKKSFSCFSKLF